MPRKAQASVGGLVYHVLNRVHSRRRMFYSDKDYLAFLKDQTKRIKLNGTADQTKRDGIDYSPAGIFFRQTTGRPRRSVRNRFDPKDFWAFWRRGIRAA
jgi:hypothetical protein